MTNQNSGKFRILFAVTTLLFSLFPDISEAQGLRFKGLETAIDERTSFTVFDNRTPAFENEFDIRFRFQSYRDAERGIIFRLEDKKAGTDLLSSCSMRGRKMTTGSMSISRTGSRPYR